MAFTSLNIGSPDPGSVPHIVQAPATAERVDVSELGATGTPIFGGFLREQGEYNPSLTGLEGIRHYERMRRSDGQVIATLSACKLPIRGAEWAIQEPPDATPIEKEATALVESCLLEELDLDGIIENALLMLDFGCAMHEDVWYIDGKNVRLKKCAARLPLTFYRWITEANGDDLAAVEQMGYRGGEYVTTSVPANKIALFTFRQEGANFTGQSLLRQAYQSWFIKSGLYKVEAIACERNGMGIPNITMGGTVTKEDRAAAIAWLEALSANEKASILLPPGWTFALTGVTGVIHSPKDAIDHHNNMISQAALASFINFGQGKSSGNRALGKTMSDFFYIGLQATANQIARTINMTTIRRLVDYNFAGMTRYPRLVPQQIISMAFEDVVAALQSLAASSVNLIQPDDELEDWTRAKFGAPKRTTPRPRVASGGTGGNPSGGAAGGSAALSEAFKPKRAPRGAEKFLALSEMASALDKGRDDVAAALRAARPRIQAEVIQKLMNEPVRNAHRVSVAIDAKLVAQIEGILAGVSAYGLQTVESERQKQLAGDRVPRSAATIRAAEKRDPLGVYADGVVSEYTNNLQQRAANVVLDLKRRPAADKTAGQMIIDAGATLDEQSEGWIDNVAAKGANEAFADGRNDGYEKYADEIASVQYSALLDVNTCEECAGADGQEGETPEDVPDVPNPDCDGGDKCRCVLVYIFSDEAKAAA